MSAQSITIDLVPRQVAEERRMTSFLHWSLTYGRYIIIGTELIVLLAFFSRFRLDQELTDLQQSISQKQAVIASVSEFETQIRRLENRIGKIKELDQGHTFYVYALRFLDEITPGDVVLTKLSFNGIKVQLSGEAYSKRGFSQLVKNFKRAQWIRAISVESIARGEETKSNILTFSLSFELVPQAFL